MVKEVAQREVERVLAANGWRLVRTKGGHNVWASPDPQQRPMPIPRHGTVSPGVVRKVIQAVRETPKEWR